MNLKHCHYDLPIATISRVSLMAYDAIKKEKKKKKNGCFYPKDKRLLN